MNVLQQRARSARPEDPARPHGLPDARWSPLEIAFWCVPVLVFFILPDYLVFGSQVLIVGLFALSLDLVLGYAGIVSLGHAGFFGLGAYTAGLLAAHGWGEPLSGLFAAAVVAALAGFCVSFLVVRGQDLTRLMVTLGIGLMLYEAANKMAFLTGGVDGLSGVTMETLLGSFEFDLSGRTAYVYSLAVLFGVFVLLRGWCVRRSGCRCAAFSRGRGACQHSARMCGCGWWRHSPSAPPSRAWRAGCWRRPRSSSGWMRWAFRVRPSC